jgi:hypothetical protein
VNAQMGAALIYTLSDAVPSRRCGGASHASSV